MPTFRQLKASEVLFADRDHTTTPGGIRGLRVAELERVLTTTRTAAGYTRKSDTPWLAHANLHRFKELASVENITEPGDKHLNLQINFADGTHTYMDGRELLCVEDPVTRA